MRGGKDDTAAGSFSLHGDFSGGSGGESDVDHVEAHAHEGGHDEAVNHRTGKARVASHDDFVGIDSSGFADKCGVGGGEFHHIERAKPFAGSAADSASDS